jgi:hypothetical protein
VVKVAFDSTMFSSQREAGAPVAARRPFWRRLIVGFAGLAGEGLYLCAFMVAFLSLFLSDLHRPTLLLSGLGAVLGGWLLLVIADWLSGKSFDRSRLLGALPVAAAILASPWIKALLWG